MRPNDFDIKASVRDVLLQYKESYIPKSKNNITEKKVLHGNVKIFDSKNDLEGKILQIGKKIIKRFGN